MCTIWPPSQPRNTGDMCSGASSSHINDDEPSASHTLECRWHDDPHSSIAYFAMNVIERSLSPAISFAPFL